MSWQASLTRALRDLKQEEARLSRELERVRAAIASLGGVSGGRVAARGRGGKRKLSPQAREAIARAARKRWAKYRAEKAAKS